MDGGDPNLTPQSDGPPAQAPPAATGPAQSQAPAQPEAQPPAFDAAAARHDGVPDSQIAEFLAPMHGFDLATARKDGVSDTAIVDFLAPPLAPPPEPPPKPTEAGVGLELARATGQAAASTAGNIVSGIGAVASSLGTGIERGANNAENMVRSQVDLMNRVDAGQKIAPTGDPMDFAYQFASTYSAADPAQRAAMRKNIEGDVAALPAPGETAVGAAGGAAKAAGDVLRDAGASIGAWGQGEFPLTDEEQKLWYVNATKMVVGLLPYVGASALGGLPAVAGLAGVEGFGDHYDAAKKAGASDDTAAVAGLLGGLENAGLMTVPVAKALDLAATLPGAAKGEFLKTVVEMAKSGTVLTAFSQLQAVADNAVAKTTYEPGRDLTEGAGQNLGATFVAGAVVPLAFAGLNAAGRAAGRAVSPRPAPKVSDVLGADNVDAAIDAAKAVAANGSPVDVDAKVNDLMGGAPEDQQQGKLIRLFAGLGTGTVEQTPDGGYQYRIANRNGTVHRVPIERWEPEEQEYFPPRAPEYAAGEEYGPARQSISPQLAVAQRDHYAAAGTDVVFYRDNPNLPFDGVVDPSQPNTIFLSNNPVRNAAQVAGHEFTHVLADTKLPDGTSLGDLLNQQIAAGITPAGQAYAEATFGATAPKRGAFPAGPEGDDAHAAAVQAHLVNELGADIGGEAPKFNYFLPKVIDTIHARFGDGVAADVLTKVVTGLRAAMDTIQGFFAKTPTLSQNWVDNIGDIHDTLAKMYAERFGAPIGEAQAANVAARNAALDARVRAALPQAVENARAAQVAREQARLDQMRGEAGLDARAGAAQDVSRLSGGADGGVQFLPGTERPPGATVLPGVSRELHAGLEDQPSAIARAEAEGQLPLVRRSIQEARETGPAAVPGMREPGEPNAPSGLRPAARGGMALPSVPLEGAPPFRGLIEPADIHAIAEAAGVPHDNAPAFMDQTEALTGERHLDNLTPEELRRVAQRLQAAPGDFAPRGQTEPLGPAVAPAPESPQERSNAPSELEALDPAAVKVDANRFQLKSETGPEGVSERLQGVTSWDPRLAGTALVWRDEDGQDWVADGHQRFALAKRLMAQGHPPIRVNAFILNARDGISDGDARAYAAVKNIAEGTGSAIDAAKVMREAAANGTQLPPMPPRSALVRDGRALARLGPDAFGMAVNDVVPTAHAAMVGRLVDDHAEQAEAMRVLAEAKPENARQAEVMVRDMLASGTQRETTSNLFGSEAFASSVTLERAKVIDEAMRQLSRDKTTFRTLVSESERIEGHGRNALDAEANKARLSTDEHAAQFLTTLATRRGPISDSLTDVARRLKSGDINRAAAAREFLGVVRGAVETGLDRGPDARGVEPRPAEELEPAEDRGPALFSPREGDQEVLPGAEQETPEQIAARARRGQREEAEMRMRGRAQPKAPQEAIRGRAGFDDADLFGAKPTTPKGRQGTLFSPRDDTDRPPFYSALTRTVEGAKLDKSSPGQWLATIKNAPGVKAEEIGWSGIEDWLKAQPKSVTKADVLDYLRENEVQVHDVMHGGETPQALQDEHARLLAENSRLGAEWESLVDARADEAEKSDIVRRMNINHDRMREIENTEQPQTKFGTYSLPGGKDYRELLLTTPQRKSAVEARLDQINARLDEIRELPNRYSSQHPELGAEFDRLLTERKPLMEQYQSERSGVFKSGHWDEPNVLAHIRFDDRTDADGKRDLHLAEIQSDWHQKGRREGYSEPKPVPRYIVRLGDQTIGRYDTEEAAMSAAKEAGPRASAHRLPPGGTTGVPNAPFKTSWHELAMKRMLRYAAENGYDRLSWDTGATNADRYDLSQQVDDVTYFRHPDGTYDVSANKGGRPLWAEGATNLDTIENTLGKDIAEKIAGGSQNGKLTGLDLKVGGEGMHGFYDKILPAFVNKYAKKWGGKVEDTKVQTYGAAPTEFAVYDRRGDHARTFDARDQAQAYIDDPRNGLKGAFIKETKGQPAGLASAHSIAITPAMRDSVMQGQPLFSPRLTGAERETQQYTPEQLRAFANVGRIRDEPSFRDRVKAFADDLPRRFIRYALDPYIGVKADDPAGYMALRNANTTAGAAEMFLTDGTLKFKGDAYAMDDRNGGVEHQVVKPLHGEEHRFLWWVAANRAERLTAEDRENLFTAQDIAALKSLNAGRVAFQYHLPNGTVTHSREAIYADSLRKLDIFNKNVLDLAVESGLLERGKVNALFSNPFYVPFYRLADEAEHFAGPSVSSQFVKQNAFKTLKGGTEKLNHDLWDNAIKNWSHMIDASMRNHAATRVLSTAEANGAAVERTAQDYNHTMTKKERADTVWVMRAGDKTYYQIADPMLYTAITALDFRGSQNPIMKAANKFKQILTMGVTSNPLFMLRISIRDAEQAIATAPMSYNMVDNVVTGFKMGDLPGALNNVARAVAGQEQHRLGLSDEAADVIAGGGTMRLGAGTETGARKTDLLLNSPGAINSFWHRVRTVARAYKEVTAQGEDVQRFALYHKLIAQGVPHDEAAFAARDIEDFTLKGAGQIARLLTQVVPFMNAWAQGLYKVYRSAANADKNVTATVTAKIAASTAKRVGIVLAATTLATLALDSIYHDDEDYKKRSEYDRNAYFWFKFGSTQVRIPMGFEIAALSRIAANGVEAFFDNEMTARRFLNNVESLVGTNMAMNPTPQIVKPLLDVFQNSSGIGAPIVPAGMENLRSEDQYNTGSTLFARGVSSLGSPAMRAIFGPQAQFLSPIQIDYLVNGYLGWLGSMVIGSADRVVRSFSSEPTRPAMDLLSFATGGMVSTQTTPQSRYVDMLYQQAGAIDKAYGTYEDLLHRGRTAEAQAFFSENREEIARHGLIGRATKEESVLNQQIRRVENRTDISAEQKRVQIMQLQAQRNRSAESVFQPRP